VSELPSLELADVDQRVLRLGEAIERLIRELLRDKCDIQESHCRRNCADRRDRTILALQIDRTQCQLQRVEAMTECFVNFAGDPAGLQQCRREAEKAHQRCVAQIDAAATRAEDAYEGCLTRCQEEARECRRRPLPDHEPAAPEPVTPDPSHPDLPGTPEPSPPAPGPPPPTA
jgi:hypothetical protein